MHAALVVPVPGFRLLGGMTDEDDVQRDVLLRQVQQLGQLFLGLLLGMDAAPHRAQAQVRGAQEDVLGGGGAVLDPEGGGVEGQGAAQVAADHQGNFALDVGEHGGALQRLHHVGIGDNVEGPGLLVAGAGAAHGGVEQLLNVLLGHGFIGEFPHAAAAEQYVFQFHGRTSLFLSRLYHKSDFLQEKGRFLR